MAQTRIGAKGGKMVQSAHFVNGNFLSILNAKPLLRRRLNHFRRNKIERKIDIDILSMVGCSSAQNGKSRLRAARPVYILLRLLEYKSG